MWLMQHSVCEWQDFAGFSWYPLNYVSSPCVRAKSSIAQKPEDQLKIFKW